MVFPANTRAGVTAVKAIENATTVRELERALRDAGLSKNAAQYVVKLCRPSLREAGVEESAIKEKEAGFQMMLSEIRRVNASLRLTRELHS